MKLNVPVLKSVLSEPHGIKTGDLFPDIRDFDRIQRYMHDEMGIGTLIKQEKFIDIRFIEACMGDSARERPPSILNDPSDIVWEIYERT